MQIVFHKNKTIPSSLVSFVGPFPNATPEVKNNNAKRRKVVCEHSEKTFRNILLC